jgi:tetratricopeptide (TPR) repeat protein
VLRPSSRILLLLLTVVLAGCRPHGVEALRQGDEALRAGQHAKAIELLEQAVTDLPSEARAWNFLGLAYRAAGRDHEALKAHLRALERNRSFPDAWFNVGLLHFEQGNWLEAERALRTYLGAEASRTNAVAWRTLGLAQLESNQLDLAERSLATATQLAPRDAEAWNGVGLIQVGRRRFRDALKTFAYVSAVAPEHAPARLNAAVVTHQHLGDRRGAVPLYRAYLALNPANAAEVETLVAQLEQALRPVVPTNAPVALVATNPPPRTNAPLRLATNLVSRATNVPAKPATNLPPTVTKAPPTNPPPVVTTKVPVPAPATNPPAKPVPPPAVPPVVKKPEPKPEVVQLEPEPRLAVARDVKPAAPQPLPTTNPPAAVVPAPPTNAVAPVPPATASAAELTAEEAERRGFWQRANPGNWNWRKANPVSWFGSDDPAVTNRPTPLNQTTTNVPAARRTLALPRVPTNAPVAAAPSKPKPVIIRHQRQVSEPIAAGNRSAAELKFNEALLVHNRRDYAGAAALYEQAASADPTFYPAHHNLALLALDLNDPTRAVLAAEHATTLQPDSTASRQLYAAALQRANYPADAAEQWELLQAGKPNDTQTHLTLAGLYAGPLGESAKARAHYLRVLELEPNHPQAAAIRVWLAGNP